MERLLAADSSLVGAKKQNEAGKPLSMSEMVDKLREILVGRSRAGF